MIQETRDSDEAIARILVVEDNEKLAVLLRRYLERAGYEVIIAASGAEMIKAIHASRPDLIVLDIGLPDADGRDLLAGLKSDPQTLRIPVLVWSGRFPDSDRRIALSLGAEDFIEKGSPSVVIGKIERVLLRISERELLKARESLESHT